MKSLLQSAITKRFISEYQKICILIDQIGENKIVNTNESHVIFHLLISTLYWLETEQECYLIKRYQWFVYPEVKYGNRQIINHEDIIVVKQYIDLKVAELFSISGNYDYLNQYVKNTNITGFEIIEILSKHINNHLDANCSSGT